MKKTDNVFAERILNTPTSFVREILKSTDDPAIISFAGGLPSKETFPLTLLQQASQLAIEKFGERIFQYGRTTGYEPLKEWIAQRYWDKHGIRIGNDEILLTSGSQQGIDIIAKTFLNKGDQLIIEEPGYLGAIQAYHSYEPQFLTVPLEPDGMSIDKLEAILSSQKVKLIHIIPNHQNPSGVSYSKEKKELVCRLAAQYNAIIVEDDPYIEINFGNYKPLVPAISDFRNNAIHLGSFSKTIAPGLRLGWLVANKQWISKLEIAKQSCDLHTNNLSQAIVHQLLMAFDFDLHVSKTSKLYQKRAESMQAAIKSFLPHNTVSSDPKGGMFIWCELESHMSSRIILKDVMKKCVFVPGDVFHVNNNGHNAMRLNFSNSDSKRIVEGIKVIGNSIRNYKFDNTMVNIKSTT